MGKKVFVSWSGGKDSYLAMLKAREAGLTVHSLVTFMNKEERSMSHSIGLDLLKKQAAALGLPLEVEPVTWDSYEDGFLNIVQRIKEKGLSGGVFGDINLKEHREWVEKMCERVAITPYLPLWGMEEKAVIFELFKKRARLIIIALKDDLKEKWLGKELDLDFYRMCLERGFSPCGERGEYHTLVVDGPLFKNPLKYCPEGIIKKEGRYFLKIK